NRRPCADKQEYSARPCVFCILGPAVLRQPRVDPLHTIPFETIEIIVDGMECVLACCVLNDEKEEVFRRPELETLLYQKPEPNDCGILDQRSETRKPLDCHLTRERVVSNAHAEFQQRNADVALALVGTSVAGRKLELPDCIRDLLSSVPARVFLLADVR